MRNLTIVTKNLLIINVLAFIATWVVKGVGIDLQSMCGCTFSWQTISMFINS